MTVKAMPVHSLLISLLLAVLVAGGVLLVGTQAQAQQDPLPPFFIRCDIGTPSPGAVGICAETFPPDYPPPNAGGGTGLVFCPPQDASDGTIECITTVPGTTGTQPNDVSTCTFVET